jgi:uncharacterized caspase-like protein
MTHTTKLENPKNDAADVARVLRELGLQVLDGFDLDKSSMDRRIRAFSEALVGADVGVFYYAGHGLQVAGQNYLEPVDAELKSGASLDFEAGRLELVQRSMERETQTGVLFLDACRDNPMARNLARSLGTRSSEVGRGLATQESGAALPDKGSPNVTMSYSINLKENQGSGTYEGGGCSGTVTLVRE